MPQEAVSQKSELEILLERNAYTNKGLTPEEFKRANKLIASPEFSEENCWLCEMGGKDSDSYRVGLAIYDTGLCQECARYALYTRK